MPTPREVLAWARDTGLPLGALDEPMAHHRSPRASIWHGLATTPAPNAPPNTLHLRTSTPCAEAKKLALPGRPGPVVATRSWVQAVEEGVRVCTAGSCGWTRGVGYHLAVLAGAAEVVLRVREAAGGDEPGRLAAAVAALVAHRDHRSAHRRWGTDAELLDEVIAVLDAEVARYRPLLETSLHQPALLRRYYVVEVHPRRSQISVVAAPEGFPSWAVVSAAHAAWAHAILVGGSPLEALAAATESAESAAAPLRRYSPAVAISAEAVRAAVAALVAEWDAELDTLAATADSPWQLVSGQLWSWRAGGVPVDAADWLAEAYRVFGGHLTLGDRHRRHVIVAVPAVLAERIAEASVTTTKRRRGVVQLLGPAGDRPERLLEMAGALWDPGDIRAPLRRVGDALDAARLIDSPAAPPD